MRYGVGMLLVSRLAGMLATGGMLFACSSSSSSSTLFPDITVTLSTLSTPQLQALCDSLGANTNGFDSQDTLHCDGGQVAYVSSPYISLDQCVSETQSHTQCPATVQDFDNCVATGYPALCTDGIPAACTVYASSACMPESTASSSH